MSFSSWLLAAAAFIVILTIALAIGWGIRNNSIPTPAPPNTLSAPLVWSVPIPGPNPSKNTCQLYEFPTGVLRSGGVSIAVPGNPTFNALLLDHLQGVSTIPGCLDPDQILAQQVQHGCTAPIGVVDGAITRCFLIDGGTTGLGGSEVFYSNTNCLNISACPGVLSLVSLNFQSPSNPDIFCIQDNGSGRNATMDFCTPINTNQLFRVTRTNPGQNPNSLKPGQGQNGLIAQILDRNTGLCLVAGHSTTSSIYDPTYSGCTGSQQTFSGTNVVMGPCTGGIYPGYLWALIPSIPYCGVPGGCFGCTGCPPSVCMRCPGGNSCGDGSSACNAVVCSGTGGSCHGNAITTTPPQIVYIGNLDITQAPIGNTGYAGLTGTNALIKWLIDNKAESLYYGGAGDGLILRQFGTDIAKTTASCSLGDQGFVAQYMNLPAYNTISSLAVCLAEGTLGTINCVPL